MISLRYRSQFEPEDWTYTSFDGPDEDQARSCLIAALARLEYTIQQSDRHGDFYTLGEEEEGNDDEI